MIWLSFHNLHTPLTMITAFLRPAATGKISLPPAWQICRQRNWKAAGLLVIPEGSLKYERKAVVAAVRVAPEREWTGSTAMALQALRPCGNSVRLLATSSAFCLQRNWGAFPLLVTSARFSRRECDSKALAVVREILAGFRAGVGDSSTAMGTERACVAGRSRSETKPGGGGCLPIRR